MVTFRTSARSVDMLGRQQIAGIPTAVSEIFKNAYDAYAVNVRGDYFPDRRVLLIRDDGIGMSRTDFETRWLTVGTDSKAYGSVLPKIPRPRSIAERRQMGEKGIGRLAIATLAPQLLAISRPLRNVDTPDDGVVVALIQWSLFEVPGLTLEDVSVPIRDLKRVEDIDNNVLSSMRQEFSQAFERLGQRVPDAYRDRIAGELQSLDFDPRT
ncbi:MAG: dctB 1 [Frankiales bacterium]|nr:dctB 1 [Frankiales bacterium]